jgi:hypothetical protein
MFSFHERDNAVARRGAKVLLSPVINDVVVVARSRSLLT